VVYTLANIILEIVIRFWKL